MIICFIIIINQRKNELVSLQRHSCSSAKRNQSRWLSAYLIFNQDVNRQRVNLSWGMNEKQTNKSYSPLHNKNDISTIPTTINPKIPSEHENSNTIKVLTETSDDEQEELMKLIKAQNEKKADHEVIDMFNKSRRR